MQNRITWGSVQRLSAVIRDKTLGSVHYTHIVRINNARYVARVVSSAFDLCVRIHVVGTLKIPFFIRDQLDRTYVRIIYEYYTYIHTLERIHNE